MADSASPTPRPALRRDAQRNRERILEAARELLRAEGPGVPVDEIARAAGIGMGTLYRHFSTKDALIDAIVVVRFAEMARAAAEAEREPDPASALRQLLTAIVALQVQDQGFRHALGGRAQESPEAATLRGQMVASIRTIVERGRDAGALRADLTEDDVLAVMWATGRVVERGGADGEAKAQRFLELHLVGLRA